MIRLDIKKYTEANRKAWNEVAPKHEAIKREAKQQFFMPGYSCLDEVITEKLKEIGLGGKHVAHVCCNDGVETLSLKNLGAASCTGFDISDEAVASARKLAEQASIACDFVRTDIYELPDRYHGKFDLVYISAGALIWFPDLPQFFHEVRHLLKEGGKLLIYEMHPFLNMLDEERSTLRVGRSYFIEEPQMYDDGITYMGNETYQASVAYNFDPTLSDIINGLIHEEFGLEEFREFPHDLSAMFEHLEDLEVSIPMSFILVAQRDGNNR